MPYRYKKLSYWVLLLNCLILIAAGHGVAPMILFELVAFPASIIDHSAYNFCIGYKCNYEDSLLLTAILSLVGQAIMLFANKKGVVKLRPIALGVMYFGLYNVCKSPGTIALFTFISSIPFLVLSGYLWYLLLRDLV